jgi:hypothetical protein
MVDPGGDEESREDEGVMFRIAGILVVLLCLWDRSEFSKGGKD